MGAASLTTTTERVDRDRVKVRVEVPEAALDPAKDAVYRRWAREIKVPGFRKGKVPRQLIDARVGPGAVREEAIREALPELYREALQAEAIEPIAPPDIDIVSVGELDGPLVFEAIVDVRPEIEIPDLASITVEAPSPQVTDADLAEQLDKLRDRFAELETVHREARRGDFVVIDIRGYRGSELVEGLTAPDYLYEVGSRSGPPTLDEELEGNRPGAILKFTDRVAVAREGSEEAEEADVSFTVLLKEVKAKRLPPLDDDFAKTVGEFETLDELKADLRGRLAEVKRQIADQELRNRALTALVERARFEPPNRLVEKEFEHRLEHFTEDLRRAGLTLDDYGRQSQLTELEIRRDLRSQAERSVKAELLLDEIARSEGIEVSDEEVGREVAYLAARSGRDPKELAEQLVVAGRLDTVVVDLVRRKALDHLVSAIGVTGDVHDEA